MQQILDQRADFHTTHFFSQIFGVWHEGNPGDRRSRAFFEVDDSVGGDNAVARLGHGNNAF